MENTLLSEYRPPDARLPSHHHRPDHHTSQPASFSSPPSHFAVFLLRLSFAIRLSPLQILLLPRFSTRLRHAMRRATPIDDDAAAAAL